jgi:hypothetical protein
MAKHKGKLDDEQRRFIVGRLAMYDSPQEVADAVKEQFGVEISRQVVFHYDPEHSDCAQKWKDLHAATRKQFLEKASEVSVAQQAYRLRRLDEMERRARKKGNLPLAASILEQAAKEVGGAFTSRRELTGANGVPLAPPVVNIVIDGDPQSGERASASAPTASTAR